MSWQGRSPPSQIQGSRSLPLDRVAESNLLSSNNIQFGLPLEKKSCFFRAVSGDAIKPMHSIVDPLPGAVLVSDEMDGCKTPPIVMFSWEVAEDEPHIWWFYLGTANSNRAYYNSGELA